MWNNHNGYVEGVKIMEIETKGLGAGSYPEPNEQKSRYVFVKIMPTYVYENEFPIEWDDEVIKAEIRENLKDYIRESDVKDYEIEIE